MKQYFEAPDFTLYQGDCIDIIPNLNLKFDMVFADPPYFLSGGGKTVKSGKIVSVDKGDWDKPHSYIDQFNLNWMNEAYKSMKDNATIWICASYHNLLSILKSLDTLNLKVLNIIVWQKSNPPPNFSKRVFTHSTEFVIWARKHHNIAHTFNYELMKKINDGKQMKDIWKIARVSKLETKFGKHPTQKPLKLLNQIVLASTNIGDLILDPFCGSGTTGISVVNLGRRFVGVDVEKEYLEISKNRNSASEFN